MLFVENNSKNYLSFFFLFLLPQPWMDFIIDTNSKNMFILIIKLNNI